MKWIDKTLIKSKKGNVLHGTFPTKIGSACPLCGFVYSTYEMPITIEKLSTVMCMDCGKHALIDFIPVMTWSDEYSYTVTSGSIFAQKHVDIDHIDMTVTISGFEPIEVSPDDGKDG